MLLQLQPFVAIITNAAFNLTLFYLMVFICNICLYKVFAATSRANKIHIYIEN